MKTDKDFSTFNPLTEGLIRFKRQLFESLYSGTLTVWTFSSETSESPYSALEESKKTVLLDEVPCRIIRQFGQATEDIPKKYDTTIRIMLAPEIKVPPGSILRITFMGHTKDYRQTSEPIFHSDHQVFTCEVYRPGRGDRA